jgi:apolipoprotein N-acyltransferase
MALSKEKWSLYWLAKNRPWWLVILSGLLLAASFPPSPLGPLAFIGFVPLFILMESLPEQVMEDRLFFPFKAFWVILFRVLTLQFLWRKQIKTFRYERKMISGNAQAFRYTYFAFFIWNLLCCYWLCLTVLNANDFQDALERMVAGLLAITLNPLLMSIPWQFYTRVRHVFTPIVSAACLIAFWISFEYFHLHWELTWSWLTLGHALTNTPALLQYVEITGVLGASVYILIANLLVYAWLRNRQLEKGKSARLAGGAVAWILLPLLLNVFLLNPNRAILQSTGTVNVRVIQPNIDPEHKFKNQSLQEQMENFLRITVQPGADSIDLVVLPETAMPFAMSEEEVLHAKMMRPFWMVIDTFDFSYLTGVIEERIFIEPEEIPASASVYNAERGIWRDNYNAAMIMKPGRKVTFYEKSKLVPLVERMPFLDTFTWLKNMGIDMGTGMGGYGIPDSIVVLQMHNGVKIGMMICYESEFGDFVRLQTLKGAQILTIITNDGWWDQSSGYIQHAQLGVLRAIENRRDIARSANTGRSCFIDAKGHMRQATDWWVPARIDGKLNLHEGLTFYVRHGDYLGWLACFASAGICVWAFIRKRKTK